MQQVLFEDLNEEAPGEEAELLDYRFIRNQTRAAEFFVGFDISTRGFDCFMVGEGLRYDLIADVGGVRRFQVKSNLRAVYRHPNSVSTSYTFGNKHDLRDYASDIDAFAFVAIDRFVVLYALPVQMKRAQLHINSSMMTQEASNLSWQQVLRLWGID